MNTYCAFCAIRPTLRKLRAEDMFETWVSDDCPVTLTTLNLVFPDTYSNPDIYICLLLLRRMILRAPTLWLLQKRRTPVRACHIVIPPFVTGRDEHETAEDICSRHLSFIATDSVTLVS